MSLLHDAVHVESLTVLSRFRTDFYDCLTSRADALFDLADAVLCTDGPVRSLVDLALAPEHRRGHGSLYTGLNRGRLDVARLRRTLAGVPLPRAAGGRACRRSERRIKAAGSPREKSLRAFDFDVNPNIDAATIHTLASREWIKKSQPLCLIGDSGAGKSHMLIALGTEAAMKGCRVRYTLATKLVNELVEAADEKQPLH